MEIERGAEFSLCRAYRYRLWRLWDRSKPYALFIGLNPSTADENEDDPTIRRCINFADSWGYGGLVMANLFAICATNPKVMLINEEPVGPGNNMVLLHLARNAGIIIAAWGSHGGHMGRDKEVLNLIPNMHHLGLTKDGKPRHPLYLKADTKPALIT